MTEPVSIGTSQLSHLDILGKRCATLVGRGILAAPHTNVGRPALARIALMA